MAEVLCPLIPSSGPVSSIQDPVHEHHNTQPRHTQMHRNSPNGAPGYRGTSPAPAYAFKSTPTLRGNENRAGLPPQPPSPGSQFPPLGNDNASAANRQRYPSQSPSSPSLAPVGAQQQQQQQQQQPTQQSGQSAGSTWSSLFKTNESISKNFQLAPFSTDVASETLPAPSTSAALTDAPTKPSPERYRRGHRRADTAGTPTGSVQAAGPYVTQEQELNGQYKAPSLNTQIPAASHELALESPVSAGAEAPQGASSSSSMRRYKRRGSGGTMDSRGTSAADEVRSATSNDSAPALPRPSSSRQERPSSPLGRAPLSSTRSDGSSGPARTFAEVARRTNGPSPLSRPMTPSESQGKPVSSSSPPDGQGSAFSNSPAAAAMAALNDRDANKGVKSRLRRAFSFGSSAEMKRAAEVDSAAGRAQARKEQFSNELDEEQDAIARQQEAAGLGESIYSGQAGFIGSTDNLSISSTASSASLMLRKMGRGMKKGGRSIKGLFRPKSAIGVPPPDGPLGASIGEVSRVTVEAEREKVNVNANASDQAGGGTGFPKLDRNSIDAVAEMDNANGHRPLAIETERQEIAAGMRRSILKRTNTGSPTASPGVNPADVPFMSQNNHSFERRPSPSPSNASSEARRVGHGRGESSALNGDDYFGGVPRIGNQSSRSLPATPRGLPRNISFNTRLQFHDVWSSTDYDRRGDIATCNRLTPMLAQQIKEELNSFKMEMEVHEASKPHTHFF